MVILSLLLTLISFWQVSFLSFNLILIILLVRSFILPESRSTYLLGFFLGILTSLLDSSPLGLHSLIFLLTIKLVSTVRLSALASHYLSLIPIALCLFIINAYFYQIVFSTSFSFLSLIWQTILVIPLYWIVRFWEEGGIYEKKTTRSRLYG